MQEDSRSEDSFSSTVTSKYRALYVCPHCFKEFDNGHAFAGHQNAHRLDKTSSRSRKMDAQASILGSVLDHNLLPSHYDNNPPPLAPVGGEAAGMQGHPPSGVQPPPGFDVSVPKCPRGVLKVKPRANHGSPCCHSYEVGMMMNKVAQLEKGADSDSQRTMTDRLIMVSRKDDDGFEREEELDLELRLGSE
ncbi:hypothetical protein GH714_031394 [Hevea brasiliensis]|uniref:C2H2-type domain-containing protein n=1 Tax=Hevea brasiliensis TaxID=3981 RepID=A0A6A6M5W7_HEVBR|nr:hypothetical protein GH714_031394 [Hevea brasiliensis]